MSVVRSILAIWTTALLAGLAACAAAEPLPLLVTTTATTTLDSGGRPWIYVALGENRPGLLARHRLAVSVRTGPSGPFVPRGAVASTADPTAVGVFLSRGASVGDSLPALEAQLVALHAVLSTPPGEPTRTNAPAMALARRVAALLTRAEGDSGLGNLLDLYGLAHPALRLARGTAWAGRLDVPVGTEVTIEIREQDGAGTDLAVVGRATVHAGQPERLPAPGPLAVVPDLSARGDLAVKLRWATPEALRRAGSRHQGDVAWRVDRSLAEAKGLDKTLPTAAVLDGLALSDRARAARLPGPVFPAKWFDAANVANFIADGTNTYIADDHGRYAAGGVPFAEGSQYYYFAAAADALGRPGDVSAGVLATVCRRIPPPVPTRLAVTRRWNPTDGQYWEVSWASNPGADGTTTTRYELFRGFDFARLTAGQRGGLDLDTDPIVPGNPGAIRRIAVVTDPGGAAGQILRWREPGDASYGTNWWFAVRAIHASPPGCPNLASPLGPPALGSLVDNSPPAKPDLTSLIDPELDCLRVACIVNTPAAAEIADPPIDASVASYIARCTRQPGVGAARFRVTNTDDGSVVLPETSVVFPPDEDTVEIQWTLPLSNYGATLRVECAAEALGTLVGTWTSSTATGVYPSGNQRMAHAFLAGVIPESERRALPKGDRLFGSLTPGCSTNWPSDTHLVVSPASGRILHPWFNIPLGPTARQYRLYRRIDDGPLTLVAQGLQAYAGPGSHVRREDPAPPAANGIVHYYSQFLDENGRASGMRRLARLAFTGDKPPVPVLVTPTAHDFDGTPSAPTASLSWVVPPEHCERFEVFFTTDRPPAAPGTSITPIAHLVQKPAKVPMVFKVRSKRDALDQLKVPLYESFVTGRVGGDLGAGPRFTVTMKVDPALKYHVWIRSVGPNGETGDPSRKVEFQWMPPAAPPANIAWPARPLPPVATFNAGIQAIDFRDLPPSRLIWSYSIGGAASIPLHSVGVDATPIGIRVGSLVVDNARSKAGFDTVAPFGPLLLTPGGSTTYGKADPNLQTFTRDGDRQQRLLPAVLYRTQVSNERFPDTSGDVVQCSPLIRSIAWKAFRSDGNLLASELIDPLFRWIGPEFPASPQLDLYLVDTQPVVRGARYRYWLVRFSELGEPVQTVPCGEATVKSP